MAKAWPTTRMAALWTAASFSRSSSVLDLITTVASRVAAITSRILGATPNSFMLAANSTIAAKRHT
jgi:hypothetical protein